MNEPERSKGAELNGWREAIGPVAALVALVIGVVGGEGSGARVGWFSGVGALFFVVAAFVRHPQRRLTVAIAASLTLGCGLGSRAASESHWPMDFARSPTSSVIEVSLIDDPGGHPFARSALATTVRVDGFAVHRRVLVRGADRVSLRMRALTAGDRVTLVGRAGPLGPDDDFARSQGAVAIVRADDLIAFDAPGAWYRRAGAVVRRWVGQGTERMSTRDGPLLLGFLLGDTRDIDRVTIEQFRAAGMTHLLAVSGANVAFVLALVGPILRRIGIVARNLVGLGVVLVFAAATRFEPSVLRAGAMAAVVMIAGAGGRAVAPARALAIAVFSLVVLDPHLLRSVGFRLSVAATAGIVVGAGPLAARLRGPSWWRETLAVSISAQVAVAPLLVMQFGSVPAAGLVANLLAVPAAEPLTVYGLVVTPVAGVVPARLARLLLAPCSVLLGWVRLVAATTASFGVTVARDGLVLLGVALVLVAWFRRRIRRRTQGEDERSLDVAQFGDPP